MIELIYLENGLYIKKLLNEAFENYNDENCDLHSKLDYESFVEKVFTDVINWYSWEKQEDDECLALLGYDKEIAEDLLDSISGLTMEALEDWSVKFSVEYVERINAIIVRSAKTNNDLILPDPSIYAQSYEKMKTGQLTKLARLLDELRISKTRSDCKL